MNLSGSTPEQKIVEILTYGDDNSKKKLIANLICNEKIFILKKIKEKWGDDYYNKIVEEC